MDDLSKVLEIGCSHGHRLNRIAEELEMSGFGIDPSYKAIKFMIEEYPHLNAVTGFADEIPFEQSFDLIHLGFFLYLVDRSLILKCMSEVDRLVRPGGFISILDFDTPLFYSNDYSHKKGVKTFKQNNASILLASHQYSLVNKYSFSLDNIDGFNFTPKIDNRVSLQLLYKEKNLFDKVKFKDTNAI